MTQLERYAELEKLEGQFDVEVDIPNVEAEKNDTESEKVLTDEEQE